MLGPSVGCLLPRPFWDPPPPSRLYKASPCINAGVGILRWRDIGRRRGCWLSDFDRLTFLGRVHDAPTTNPGSGSDMYQVRLSEEKDRKGIILERTRRRGGQGRIEGSKSRGTRRQGGGVLS